MSDAVLVINTAGTVVSVNQAALNLLDIADKAAALRPLDQYDRLIAGWHVGQRDFAPTELRRTLKGDVIPRQRATITTAKGRERPTSNWPSLPPGTEKGQSRPANS